MASNPRSAWTPPRSFEEPLYFDFHDRVPSKTIDLGDNGTSGCLDPLGRILQLNTLHPRHGIVLASPYEQFDGSRFYEQAYVRQYRRKMLDSVASVGSCSASKIGKGPGSKAGTRSGTDTGITGTTGTTGTTGFGLRFADPVDGVAIDFLDRNHVTFSFRLPGNIAVDLSVRVGDDGEMVQTAWLSSSSDRPVRVEYSLGLDVSINRASYGQLTEGGPIAIPKSENQLKMHGDGTVFAVVNPYLAAHLEGCLKSDGRMVPLGQPQSQVTHDLPLKASYSHVREVSSASGTTIVATFRLFPHTHVVGRFEPLPVQDGIGSGYSRAWKKNADVGTFIVRRNLQYILGCIAVPVSDDCVAMLADHAALPLGWNRDNYWQIRFMMDVRRHLQVLLLPETVESYDVAITMTCKGHLRWVFEVAQRPHGYWHRSYLVTGPPKDGPVFQLDQQCYPLLELCDFFDEFPDDRDTVENILHSGVPFDILKLIHTKRSAAGLFPTDETPGDDKAEHPFHLSSHVLLWYTLSRMSHLLRRLGMSPGSYLERTSFLQDGAEELRSAVAHHFVTRDDDKPVLAYYSDGHGEKKRHHDANDIPTLFAAPWGFLTPELTPIWHRTMAWAFDPTTNTAGYFGTVGQPFAGLGSEHTPGPWPLGFFQEFAYADMAGHAAAREDAWRRICGSMQFDGLFSEAVDAGTGECTSKAWFAWPGCMIGSAIVAKLDRGGGMRADRD